MSLDETLKDIERSFGAGSILNLADKAVQQVDPISTGALTLDLALGVGGLPLGRIVEIFGPESSGKTTVVQHVLANAQKRSLRCALIDAEHAFDPDYAVATGCDAASLLISQPNSAEEALEIASMLVQSGEIGVVAIDSVAALTPKAELDGEMGQLQVGLQARLMGQAMRKLVGPASRANTMVLLTNQIREKVGVMFGSPETQPGGRALKFAASVRMDIRRIATDKDSSGEAVQNRVRVKVVKNKVAAPYKQAEFALRFGEGIDTVGELLDLGVAQAAVKKSGSWFVVGDERAQGFEAARILLAQNEPLMALIREKALS
jgi:recombination protein RecA